MKNSPSTQAFRGTRADATSATPAARPSMLSSRLNALVIPTTHSSVTSTFSQSPGRNEVRTPEPTRMTAASDLARRPWRHREPAAEHVVGQADGEDQRPAGQQSHELRLDAMRFLQHRQRGAHVGAGGRGLQHRGQGDEVAEEHDGGEGGRPRCRPGAASARHGLSACPGRSRTSQAPGRANGERNEGRADRGARDEDEGAEEGVIHARQAAAVPSPSISRYRPSMSRTSRPTPCSART